MSKRVHPYPIQKKKKYYRHFPAMSVLDTCEGRIGRDQLNVRASPPRAPPPPTPQQKKGKREKSKTKQKGIRNSQWH